MLGDGSGVFGDSACYAVLPYSGSVTSADFDDDDDPDLAVASYMAGSLQVFLGNGDGTFQDMVGYPAGDGPSEVVAADFDGDGRIDLASANDLSDDVSVLLNNGDGTFGDRRLLSGQRLDSVQQRGRYIPEPGTLLDHVMSHSRMRGRFRRRR